MLISRRALALECIMCCNDLWGSLGENSAFPGDHLKEGLLPIQGQKALKVSAKGLSSVGWRSFTLEEKSGSTWCQVIYTFGFRILAMHQRKKCKSVLAQGELLPLLFCEGHLNSGCWDPQFRDERLGWHNFPARPTWWNFGEEQSGEVRPHLNLRGETCLHQTLPLHAWHYLSSGTRLTMSQCNQPFLQTRPATTPQAPKESFFCFFPLHFFFLNQVHSYFFNFLLYFVFGLAFLFFFSLIFFCCSLFSFLFIWKQP